MPIYEYRCRSCHKQFEMLQKISSAPLQTCIHCGGSVEKLISAPSFQFKGDGWYVTDYRDKPKKKDDAPEPPSESKAKTTDKKDNGND